MSKKSSLLIDTEDVLIVLTPLAVLIGDREAIALQQIHYWLEINRKANKAETHFTEDKWWSFNTWNEWQKNNFPFWSVATIQRVFESLANKGLVILRDHEKRNKGKWVTICYAVLEALKSSGEPVKKRVSKRVRSSQTDKTSGGVGSSQTDMTGLVKLTRPSSQTDKTTGTSETNADTTSETSIAADAAPDVSPVPKQQKPKPKSTAPKPRSEYPEPDAVYEAVERHVFEIEGTPDMPYDWKGHCGYITKWLKGEIAKWNIHEFGKISAPASPEHVERFIKWYREERKGTPLPTTPATFVKNWRQWATALKAVAPKPAAQQHTNVRENWTPERQAELERREAETKRRMAERLGKPEGRPA